MESTIPAQVRCVRSIEPPSISLRVVNEQQGEAFIHIQHQQAETDSNLELGIVWSVLLLF